MLSQAEPCIRVWTLVNFVSIVVQHCRNSRSVSLCSAEKDSSDMGGVM